MNKKLSLGQYLIMIVVILLLNNVILSYFFRSGLNIERFVSGNELDRAEKWSETHKGAEVEAIKDTRKKSTLSNQIEDRHVDENQNLAVLTLQVPKLVEQYMASDEFLQVLDNRNAKRRERLNQFQKEIDSLSASELISAYSSTNDFQEKGLLTTTLFQMDLTEIDSSLLKEFYNAEGLNYWLKEKLLTVMFNQKDEQALSLTKQFVEDGRAQTTSYEIWRTLYDLDRDYVIETASEMSINELANGDALFSSLRGNSDDLKVFFNNQLDNILSAQNFTVFQTLTGLPVDMSLSRSQQQKVENLLSSESRTERRFALNFINSIDDADVLKDHYDNLTSSTEKVDFVSRLVGSVATEAQRQLAQEIIDDSDLAPVKQLQNSL